MIYNTNPLKFVSALDSNSIDFIFTDIPYGYYKIENGHVVLNNFGKVSTSEQTLFTTAEFDTNLVLDKIKRHDIQKYFTPLFNELYRVIKPNHSLLSFCLPRLSHTLTTVIEDVGFTIKDIIVWVYDSPTELKTGQFNYSINHNKSTTKLKNSVEFIIVAQKVEDNHEFHINIGNKLFPKNVIELISTKTFDPFNRYIKPLELCCYIIQQFSNENEKVLDPFMGLGSIAISASILDREFIGIEENIEQFNLIKSKILKSKEIIFT